MTLQETGLTDSMLGVDKSGWTVLKFNHYCPCKCSRLAQSDYMAGEIAGFPAETAKKILALTYRLEGMAEEFPIAEVYSEEEEGEQQ